MAPNLKVVPPGIHRPACASHTEHVARSVNELAEFWNLLDFVDRVNADWEQEQVIRDCERDPEVRAIYGLDDFPPEAA